MSPLTAFSLRSVLYTGLPTGKEPLIAGAIFQGCFGWLFTKFPCWTQNSYSAGGCKQTTEAHTLRKKKKKKEDETWANSQREEDSYWWGGTHMGYELFCNALTKCSTLWRQVVCWGSLLANQQCFLLKPRHCASSSLLHSCEHCVDPRTQYYFVSILDRVPN